jgi:hypothetical protein
MRLTAITALTTLAVAIATGASCQEPINRSADWFLANPDAIPAALEWCHDHPTEEEAAFKRGDQSCIHVEQANARILERQLQPK